MKRILLNGEYRSYDVENLIQLVHILKLDPKESRLRKTAKS